MLILLILVLVTGLVVWSLQLMQAAFNHREFSLMLAGTLVAMSAAGIIVVYFLMEGYMGYMTNSVRYQVPLDHSSGMVVETWPDSANTNVSFSREALDFNLELMDNLSLLTRTDSASHS